MEIIIHSVHCRPDSTLQAFVKEKVGKLFNQSDRIIRANVTLSKRESRNQENKSCEIRLIVPGNDHLVKKCSGAYQKSVLQAVEVLQKILRRTKSKPIAKRYV